MQGLLVVELRLDDFLPLSLVLDVLVFVLNIGHGSFLPVFEILFVVVEKQRWVHLFELLDVFLVHNHEHGGQDLGAVSVHKQLTANFILVHKIAEVLDHEGVALLLGECVELVFELVLVVNLLLEFLITGFLNGDDFCANNLQRFVHGELVTVPLEVLNVLINS